MSVWDLMPTCWYVADTGHHLSALWCLVRLAANLWVCCRHWKPSTCAKMSLWDSISTCWYVADTGHHLSAPWCLCETWCQLVGMLQTQDTILMRCDVCVRLDASLLVCCRHWTPCKCAMMSVWDSISTYWYVADTGHHLSAPWCLCGTWCQLFGMLQTHETPSKWAMMPVWNLMPTCWYVADKGHHLSAPWCLCETRN